MNKRNKKSSEEEKIKKLENNISKNFSLENKYTSKDLNSYMAMNNKFALQAMKPYMTMDRIAKQFTAMGHLMSQNREQHSISERMIPQVRKNLNSIKNARLQIARGAVQLEYFKRTEATANIFRAAIKPFKLGTSLENNYSQIVKATDVLQKSAEKTFGKHSENIKVAEILMKNGWVTSEFFYNDILKNNYQKSEDKILEYVKIFYTENNYQRFYRVFNLVIEEFKEQNLNEGYRLLLLKIRKIIKHDFDNFDLLMNTVFSIAEYVCCYKFGILSTNGFIKKEVIKSVRKDYADKNGHLTEIDIMSMFGVLKDWWKNTDFKKGLERTDFGRNPIEHGRYDPRRYKETDFIKLILFIFNVLMAPDRNTYKQL